MWLPGPAYRRCTPVRLDLPVRPSSARFSFVHCTAFFPGYFLNFSGVFAPDVWYFVRVVCKGSFKLFGVLYWETCGEGLETGQLIIGDGSI
jgi:hypothetical protein